MNSYAEIGTDLEKLLHGAARLHIHLGRQSGENISTRGWSYNDLISGVLAINGETDEFVCQMRSVDTLFDTLDAMTEIGSDAVSYLTVLARLH